MEQQIKTIKARLDLYRAFKHDGTQECQNASHRMYMDLLKRINTALDSTQEVGAGLFLLNAYNEILSLYFLTSVGEAQI